MPHFDASAATSGSGSGKQGGKGARDISTIEGSQQTLSQIAASGRDDQFKYQYAVDLARQDLGGDTSDTDEFRNLVDDYYAQMDPDTSAEDMRGESGFTQAVRAVGETYDNVNDLLGDGIDWLWDNTVGNVAGGLGGLVGAFANDEDLGEAWKQAASDVVTDDTADAIASMGTGMLISAIPGLGVPLSIGLTAAQHSDDLYEALVGRDAVTRERLSEAERMGRFGSSVLDTVLAAAPAIGKAGRYIRGGNAIDDVARASDAIKASAKTPRQYQMILETAEDGTQSLKYELPQVYRNADNLSSTAMKMGAGTATPEETRAAMDIVADMAKGTGKAAAKSGSTKPARNAREAISRLVETGGNARHRAANAMGNSPYNPRNQVRQFIDSIPKRGNVLSRNQTNINAANAVDSLGTARPSFAQAGEDAVAALDDGAGLIAKGKAWIPAAANQGVRNLGNRLVTSTPGMVGGFIGSIPLSYFNYMSETGDANLTNAMTNMANPTNIAMLLAPSALRHTPASGTSTAPSASRDAAETRASPRDPSGPGASATTSRAWTSPPTGTRSSSAGSGWREVTPDVQDRFLRSRKRPPQHHAASRPRLERQVQRRQKPAIRRWQWSGRRPRRHPIHQRRGGDQRPGDARRPRRLCDGR